MKTMYGKSLVTVDSLSLSDVDSLFQKADIMRKIVTEKGATDSLKGKVMAALFYEPSSRTFSSFITAMQRLGGGIVPLNGMSHTSVVKGETLEDTVRVFSNYADAIVMRHPDPGSVELASRFATKPVINAGDGINEHPTQALIDLYTIQQQLGRIDGLHILMIGDLGHYRPTNSLSKLLALYPNVTLSLATPSQVPIQDGVRKYLQQKNVTFAEYTDFKDLIPTADVLYVTRVKKEYMSEELYKKVKGSYIVDKSVVDKMKKKSLVMHCLPRIDEIHTDVDSDPRSIYLTHQVANGLYVRMAILEAILKNK